MYLGDLIKWLEQQDQDLIVQDGFSTPHSDRGHYINLAFDPEPTARIGDMLEHAKSALGKTFKGYKGGDSTMNEYTDVFIGEWGRCGEAITTTHLKYWLLTGGQG